MNTSYKGVRALSRGLEILTAINRGARGVAEISAAVRLNRPTVYRLLETLARDGFIVRSESDGSYRPTSSVLDLSDGFRDEAWVTELAVPALRELLDEVLWPSDIATFDGQTMIARESTHRFSSLSIHRPISGRRSPMVSALGRAYIAFTSERERRKLLTALRRSEAPIDSWWREASEVSAALESARHDGFALVVGHVQEGIMAVAVPVLFRHRPLACINVVVTRSAMPARDLAKRYVAPLQKAAARIEAGLASAKVESPRRTGQ